MDFTDLLTGALLGGVLGGLLGGYLGHVRGRMKATACRHCGSYVEQRHLCATCAADLSARDWAA